MILFSDMYFEFREDCDPTRLDVKLTCLRVSPWPPCLTRGPRDERQPHHRLPGVPSFRRAGGGGGPKCPQLPRQRPQVGIAHTHTQTHQLRFRSTTNKLWRESGQLGRCRYHVEPTDGSTIQKACAGKGQRDIKTKWKIAEKGIYRMENKGWQIVPENTQKANISFRLLGIRWF